MDLVTEVTKLCTHFNVEAQDNATGDPVRITSARSSIVLGPNRGKLTRDMRIPARKSNPLGSLKVVGSNLCAGKMAVEMFLNHNLVV